MTTRPSTVKEGDAIPYHSISEVALSLALSDLDDGGTERCVSKALWLIRSRDTRSELAGTLGTKAGAYW